MSQPLDCDNLDDYLADELSASDADQFAAHVDSCSECRAAVDEQGWIDGLLRSPLRAELEAASPDIVTTIRVTLAEPRKRLGRFARRWRLTGGLAAAAALLLAAGWIVLADRETVGPSRPGAGAIARNANEGEVQPNELVAAIPPRAVVIGGSDMIAVPIESPYPDITIVRMYPVYQPAFAAHFDEIPPRADDVPQ